MAHPLVVHCKRARYDVYIGRPSKWGNPFVVGRDGSREQVIDRFEQWLLSQPELVSALGELSGKTLGCWCAPNRCHGEVLVKLSSGLAAADQWELPPACDSWVPPLLF